MRKQLLKDYIEKNNKWLNRFSERIKKDFLSEWHNINTFCDTYYLGKDLKYQEKLFCYLNDILENPKCKHCSKDAKFRVISIGYREFCSIKCSANSERKKKQIEETNLREYGHRNIAHGSIKSIIKKNNIEKYGTEYFQSTDEYKKKRKEQVLEKYGVESYTQTKEFREKSQKTCLDRYGVVNGNSTKEAKEKAQKTGELNGTRRNFEQIEKYGDYVGAVRNFSNKNFKEFYYEINPFRFKRDTFEYHLDHIYPIIKGFKNNIDPRLISHKANLQMLHWKDNKKKQGRTTMTNIDFYNLIGNDFLKDF